MPQSTIDKYNLKDEAIALLSDMNYIYTADEACELLTDKCGHLIPESDFLAFRKDWLSIQKRRELQPVPLIPPTTAADITLPRTLQELQSFSQIDLFGTLQGVASQALRVYGKTDQEGDHRSSIQALRLIMDSSESIDKKLKAMNAKDPTSIFIGNTILQNITDALSEIDSDHPEWNLLVLLKEKIDERRSQQIVDITEEDV